MRRGAKTVLTVAVQEYRDRTSGLCVRGAVVGRDVRQTGGSLRLYGQSGVQITRIAALLRERERELAGRPGTAQHTRHHHWTTPPPPHTYKHTPNIDVQNVFFMEYDFILENY